MQVTNVYAVYDLKAEVFSQPWFASTDRAAMRMFGDGCLDPETPVGRHPEDYALYRVGVWNSENGALAGTDSPVPVWTGTEAVKGK